MSAINYSKSKMYAYFSLYAYEDQDLFGTAPIGGYLNSYQLYAAVSDSVLSEEKLSSKIDTTDSKIYYQKPNKKASPNRAGMNYLEFGKTNIYNPNNSNSTDYMQEVTGGLDNDLIFGAKHGDNYHFNIGDGNDHIVEYDSSDFGAAFVDKISFGSGISFSDLIVEHIGDDLVVKFTNSTDSITIKDWYNSNQKIEKFVFEDLTEYSTQEIEAVAVINNNITYNTYNLNLGNGHTVVDPTEFFQNNEFNFGSGISTQDVKRMQSGNDLVLYYGGTSNSLTLKNWHMGVEYQSSVFKFADSTEIAGSNYYQFNPIEVVQGTDFDDFLMTMMGMDNIVIGGKGDDYIDSMDSADTYIINNGDGNDTINDMGMMPPEMQKDTIQFVDAQYDALWFAINANQALEITNLKTQEITTVNNWTFEQPIEEIQASGLDVDQQQVDQLIQAMSGFNPPSSSISELGTQDEQTVRDAINAAWNPIV